MKTTLNTLKNLYAQEHGYEDWTGLWYAHIHKLFDFEIVMNDICVLAQKAALEKAAERSDVINDETTDFIWEVDRSTITNPENLIR